ncbi:MAG: hypothetical protein II451_03605, partial [Oscillospiraceae bacterium]|nr:hypothetical protein [Oscillospiraceae bacterium]
MVKKIIYYEDAVHDDFAGNNIRAKTVPADFPFAIRNPFWLILEFVLYRLIATPLVWLIGKLGFGLKIKNRKALRGLRGTGYFLYGNHTQGMMDAYTPTLVSFPRHAHIVTGPEAVSVPVLRRLVQLLGGIPLPGTVHGYRPFSEALHLRIRQKRTVAIYPEAHIWPWYTGIRPFPDGSFSYPVRENVPAVAYVTTYRQRRIFKQLWPCMTVTLSEPFYPDPTLPPRAARKKLRDEVYGFMCRV